MEEKKQDATQTRKSKISEIFTFVKDKNGKIFIAVGPYKVSNKHFDTFDQTERYLGSKPYELIINLIGLAIYEHEEKQNKVLNVLKTAESKAEDKENA